MKYTKNITVIFIAFVVVCISYLLTQNFPQFEDLPDPQDTNSQNLVSPNKNNFNNSDRGSNQNNQNNNSSTNGNNSSYSSFITDYNLDHILSGNINRRGEATGFHHALSSKDPLTKVINITKQANSCGVYVAKVQVKGKTKQAFSSMFPDKLNKSDIIDILKVSYDKAIAKGSGSVVTVDSGSCFKISIILDNYKKIITAYPIY